MRPLVREGKTERCALAGLEESKPLYCELSGEGVGRGGGMWKETERDL